MKIVRLVCAVVVLILQCTSTSSGQEGAACREAFLPFARLQAVTGRERQLVDFLKSQLPAGVQSRTDTMGNLIAEWGAGDARLLVVTSIDEPGYVVTRITDGGFLMVHTPSGNPPSTLFHQFHQGHYVDISTQNGTVRGVVAIPSSHIYRGPRENLDLEDLLIDIGARSKAEALARGVEILDPVTAVKDIAVLSGGRVAGPMLSRKLGAFALLAALKASAANPGKRVVFAWAAQGSRRNSGVARLARVYGARKVLVVGAYARLEDRRSGVVKDPVETLGSGVLVPENGSPEAGSELLRALSAAAPGLRVRLTPSSTGALSDVAVFREAKADVVPVSIAVQFPGSLTEVIDAADLEQLIQIIQAAAHM